MARVLRHSAKVAQDAADEGRPVALRQLAEAASEPFLLVVAGEANSGKSTFLEALFGEEIGGADAAAAASKPTWFRYGDEAGDETLPDGVVVRRRPLAFLRDFNMVEVAGPHPMGAGYVAVIEDFVPMADLVLVVLPVTNPWGSAMWRFLGCLHRVWLRRVVVVLQQCDLRPPGEVAAVARAVRDRLHAASGGTIPVFPVSALRAVEARQVLRHGGDAGDLWEASGFPGVEDYLREHVGCFDARLVKMRNTLESARRVLGPGPAGSGAGTSAPAKGEPPGFARARSELEAIGIALDCRAAPDGEDENSRLSVAPAFR